MSHPGDLQAANVTWTASTDTNVVGYKVYFGTTSRSYSNVVVEGNVTNASIAGLAPGTTYYFAATTYDAMGNESGFSPEVIYTAPTNTATLTTPVASAGQFGFTVSGTAGTQYVVQASTDLVNWVAIQTNTAPFNFVDPGASAYSRRFYRTMSL